MTRQPDNSPLYINGAIALGIMFIWIRFGPAVLAMWTSTWG